ncbi:MAG: Na+/H+ antiporter NhaD/arsenite permease-like protein, partial [Oceanospirillaceae bacterium]
MKKVFVTLLLYCLSASTAIASQGEISHLDMTSSTLGYVALVIFVIGYALVIAEEFIHLRKSKPVILAAGLIWVLVAILAKSREGGKEIVDQALSHNLLEYSALLLFLLTAMIYVNAMTERNVFEALRAWLVKR